MAASQWVVPCASRLSTRARRLENPRPGHQPTTLRVACLLGEQRINPRELDLAKIELHLLENGQPAGNEAGSAVQGHPCEAVAWLANTLGKFDIPFRKGEIILPVPWRRWCRCNPAMRSA